MRLVFFYCILCVNFAFATITKDNVEALYKVAISSSANYEAVEKAQEAFVKLDKDNPSFYNKIRMATLIAVKAKHSSIFKRKGLADDSIKAFEALEPYIKESKNLEEIYEFHFFRGRTYSNFPSFMGKVEIAKEDLETAVKMTKSGLVKNRPSEETARLFFSYGKVLINEGNKTEGLKFLKEALESETLDGDDKEFAIKQLK